MLETRYEEHGEVTYKYEYSYAGYSLLDAGAVLNEWLTKFSIAKGVIVDRMWNGYKNSDGSDYVCSTVR